MRLFITTLGRLNKQTTLDWLEKPCKEAGYPLALVVQHHELDDYTKKYGHRVPVIGLPEGIDNLGATRTFMFDNFGDKKMVLLDDDMKFYVREDPNDWHLSNSSDPYMIEMLREVDKALDDYRHVGISAREGNNRIEEYSVETTRYMRFLAYNNVPPEIRPRVDGMSDFDVNLQLLEAGYPSLVIFRYAQGHIGTQTPGGCSLTRNHETHEAECAKMQELHGRFVTPRLKENKTGGEFGTRTELTIYWKKALASASK